MFKQRLKATGEPVVDEVEQHKVGPEEDLSLMHSPAPENETKACGSCYGAAGDCCNTCEEVNSRRLRLSPGTLAPWRPAA